jgi:NAD+ diphosphatase
MNSIMQEVHVRWFVIIDDKILLNHDNSLPDTVNIEPITPYFSRKFSLGIFDNIEYCCAEINSDINIPENFHALSLRNILSLPNTPFHLAVKAWSVINWDRNHQFCGRCGSVTQPFQTKGFERTCTSCKLGFFPRISPSIIVLIKKDDHLLMARGPHFLPGIYGLIAGFVEPGESLEEAVHREVYEETGLKIKNLSYFGSQPWPFPDSLMVAFLAEYASGGIRIDHDEIVEAGWYKYDDLPGRPSMSISIASTLLDYFIDSCVKEYSPHR